MNLYKFSVIVPVIYLTDYSRKAMHILSQMASENREVLFVISCADVVQNELNTLFNEIGKTNVKIVSSHIGTSNYLRYNGLKYVESKYVYYQDCDDEVDYHAIIDSMNYCDGENVICFNIRKKVYDSENKLIKDFCIYKIPSGIIKNIQFLPTNIVNKLIPVDVLKKIEFFNIPFSQDLSLSYQLFDKASHYFLDKEVYIYENNQLSTSGIKKTQYRSLLRVAIMERLLMRLCSANIYNASYIKYRYEIILQSRFAYLGVVYCPSFSCKSLSIKHFGIKGVLRHLYYYTIAYISCFKLLIKSKNAKIITI